MCNPANLCDMECEGGRCSALAPDEADEGPRYCIPNGKGFCVDCGRNVFANMAPETCTKLYDQRHGQTGVYAGKPSLAPAQDGLSSIHRGMKNRRGFS